MLGYWQDPEATSVRIGRHPVHGDRCLFTGDYGWMDADGYVYLLGRSDGVAKVRGHKVILSAVEAALHRDPSVREAVVMVCPPVAEGEERLVAFVAGRGLTLPSERELKQACALALDSYHVPQSFVIMETLPRHANGKFDRGKLARRYREQSAEAR
jgi:acyl-CoA synthetase (AMP-forming)/AMP-acid ligase II